jgi:hypothetical protein
MIRIIYSVWSDIETGADRQLNIERRDITKICVFGQGQHSTLTVSICKQSVTFDFFSSSSSSTETNGVRKDYASLDVLFSSIWR